MYNLVFDLLTDPLRLPVPALWEYISLLLVGEIAFQIAWNASPGGKYGSEIHWGVRIIAYFVIWAFLYGIIFVCQWLIDNWVAVVYILACVLFIAITAWFIVTNIKRLKAEEKEETPNARNEEQRD